MPVSAARQSGAGSEIRLQAALVRTVDGLLAKSFGQRPAGSNLARNRKFESISLQQGVWCEPGFQHDRSAIAEAESQFQKGLDQLARTSGSTSKSTNLE